MNERIESQEPDSVSDEQASVEQGPVNPERSRERVMEELSGAYYEDLLSFCERKLHGNPNPKDAALDVVQVVMMKAWENLDKMDPSQNVRGWLFKIAQNVMIDRWHSERRRPMAHADSLNTPLGEEGEGTLEERIGIPGFENRIVAREEIERILQLLDPNQAELIQLKYLEGLSNGEIAGRLSVRVDLLHDMIRDAENQFRTKAVN